MNDLAAFLLGALVSAAVAVAVVRLGARSPAVPWGSHAETAGRVEDLEKERARLNAILGKMNEGVIVLDEQLRPAFANRAARDLFAFQEVALPPRLPSPDLAALAERSVFEERAVEDVVELWFPARSSLRAHAAPLEDGGVVVVVQDVTEELRMQRLRREFVAHASHELKTPVAGVQALAAAIRRAVPDDPPAAERFAARMVAEGDRLGRLIGDLLDLSRLEETEKLPDTAVDLSEVVRNEADAAAEAAADDGISVDARVDPDIWVRGDGAQLGLAVRNLLDNAVRYTAAGGRVEASLARDDDQAIVVVADDGIGIPLDAQPRVFERFYRVDPGRSRDRGGTGLGLAIVKHVTELHGGTVGVESELGHGSRFSARLPAISPGAEKVRSIAG
ncbi:MAG: ATP-binding protein [Actinomycetota bacterium]|nr:ATP-binding protein [Actinomycetota bacterium]